MAMVIGVIASTINQVLRIKCDVSKFDILE